MPRIRFHDLRHTTATMLLSAGIHAKVVSERLGHATINITTINITLDTYSHVLPDIQEEAAAAMDGVLKRVPTEGGPNLSNLAETA
jgi:integrase